MALEHGGFVWNDTDLGKLTWSGTFLYRPGPFISQFCWEYKSKGGIEPAISENMNGRDISLDIGVNGQKTRKWTLREWGFGVEGGESWESVNTVSMKGRTFLEQLSASLRHKALRSDGWLGGKFCS